MRDQNGECLGCDELIGHAKDCPALANLLARLKTEALCIQPDFCLQARLEAAAEIEALIAALALWE